MKKNNDQKACWGGARACAGRKKTCSKKVSFNRRINEDILSILKQFAKERDITETEALESAILVQYNLEKLKGETNMKIVIPSAEGKLCSHFGHCEYFTFVEIDAQNKRIMSIEQKIPEEGISCQSAAWIASKGANIVLAGGMGMRPLQALNQNGVQVISGCPEMEIEPLVTNFLNNTLATGVNSCAGGHGNCHGGEHHCHH